MSHYKANLRDIEFNLFEVFGAGDRLGTGPFTVDAETARDADHLRDLGRAKLERKGCDLLVVNDVGSDAVFGKPTNEITILTRSGAVHEVPRASKAEIADRIWDAVIEATSTTSG